MSSKPALDKNLGQHFLVNRGILEKILYRVDAFQKKRNHKEIIEIGPGGGALTKVLLEAGYRVVAVELDTRWYEDLQVKFANFISDGKFVLLNEDATLVSFEKIKGHLTHDSITLCGNLPYNRGQEIVLRFFEEVPFVDAFVVMLQKEVADKFLLETGSRKSYGPLSVKMTFLSESLDSFFVSPGSFKPPPKVDSSVLSFARKPSEFDPISQPAAYKKFSQLLKNAFAQRRKKLSNNLRKADFSEIFPAFANKRAEELTPKDFHELYKNLKK